MNKPDEQICDTRPSGFTKDRIEALTDGIFAIAMTLLVLGIEVPQEQPLLPLAHLLTSIIPDILQYIVAFLVLAVFWVLHHNQFQYIQRIDVRLLWLNIIWLLFIGMMPFTTSLAETYINNSLAMAIFGIDVVIIALILDNQWTHATRGHCLISQDISKDTIYSEHRRIRLIGAIGIIGTMLAAVSVYLSIIAFSTIPLCFVLNIEWVRHIPSFGLQK